MYLFTWNMQGSNASTEVKWQTALGQLMLDYHIGCLQETGPVPGGATQIGAGLGGNPNYNLFAWGGTGTRPGRYISFFDWDYAGHRVNQAIVTRVMPTAWQCVWPAVAPQWRPLIGVSIGGNWYNCIHAISPGGADAAGLLVAGAGHAGTWFTAGDFNREPDPPLPTGTVRPPNRGTYISSGARYDYAYTNGRSSDGAVIDGLIMSDHFPVGYDAP